MGASIADEESTGEHTSVEDGDKISVSLSSSTSIYPCLIKALFSLRVIPYLQKNTS